MWIARRSLPFNPVRSTSSSLRPLDVVMNMAMFALVFLGADAFGVHEGGGTPTLEMLLPGLAMLGAGLVVGFLYVRRSLHRAAPLFPVDLLRIPVFALSMCTSVTAFAAQTLAYVALPFMLLEGQGRSHFEAGLVFTAWPVAIVVTAPIAGRLIARHPGGLLGGIGLSLLALGLALTATMPAHPESWQVAWRLAVCGAGFGIFQSPNNHTIVMSAPLRRAGAASGMLGTARLTGQSLGAVMLGFIFGLTGVQHGSIIALGLAAVMAAASAVFSLLRIRETGTPALPQGSH
jgi:DHA2 family multidrug resistance protein-like MFS transporter